MKLAHLLLLMTIMLASARSSATENIKFCFRIYGDYLDKGDALSDSTTEDYWATDSIPEFLRGAEYTIRLGSSSGTVLASGYLGDGLGTGDPGVACSTQITLESVNQTYWYHLGSRAFVNGNYIEARNDGTPGTLCGANISFNHTDGPGTFYPETSGNSDQCKNVFRALSAAAFSLYRHNGTNSGVTFYLRTSTTSTCTGTSGGAFSLDDCDGACNGTRNNCPGSGPCTPRMCYSDNGSKRKFTVSHEMGHGVTAAISNSQIPSADCSGASPADTKCPGVAEGTSEGNSSHHMASREKAKCAVAEAIAHFYSADTYNNHTSSGHCANSYAKPYFPASPDLSNNSVVDCEADTSDLSELVGATASYSLYPIATMHNIDPPHFTSAGCSTPWADHAAEVDWLRVFWNLHGVDGIAFNDMVDWWLDSLYANQTDPYADLATDAGSRPTAFQNSFNANASKHGVDD